MGVDDTGNNKSARGIDDLVESATGLFVLLYDNVGNAVVLDDNRTCKCPAFVDDAAMFNQCLHVG